jgi:nitrogen fixation protein NifQ
MEAKELYASFMRAASGGACDHFDAHVVASALSLAAVEGSGDAAALVSGMGLEPAQLLSLIGEVFPALGASFERILSAPVPFTREQDEACVRELLGRNASGGKLSLHLAGIVARRALRPHHLWQDLGLRNRRELSWLMERHFERLAAKNAQDMKWKKYLYRAICRDEGFALCVAPSCSECRDFDGCFGEERGDSLLLHSAPLSL